MVAGLLTFFFSSWWPYLEKPMWHFKPCTFLMNSYLISCISLHCYQYHMHLHTCSGIKSGIQSLWHCCRTWVSQFALYMRAWVHTLTLMCNRAWLKITLFFYSVLCMTITIRLWETSLFLSECWMWRHNAGKLPLKGSARWNINLS